MANINVLIVEDNPHVLRLLSTSLEKFARVRATTDPTDAILNIASTNGDERPDLIIADCNLPGLNGRQLLEKLRARATAHVPVIMLASREDATDMLRTVEDDLEDIIEKPFFVKEAAQRVKRAIDKITLEKLARESAGESVLRGSLAQMSAIDLFQSLDLGRKSCALILAKDAERCAIYFEEGQVKHAFLGEAKGEAAVYKALTWNDGTFEIDFSQHCDELTVARSTQALLMEGLRLLDESNRDGEA